MEIKSKKFTLRYFKKGDEISLQKNINNKNIADMALTIPYPYKPKDAKKWVKENLQGYRHKNKEKINFVIDINREVVGSIGLIDIKKDHKAEIGYWLAEKYWGQGIMTEAVNLILNYGFKKLKLKRIYGKVFTFNKGSQKVLKKAGFSYEGYLKKDIIKNKKLIGVYVFGKIN
ncbi:GNAT family N-acetyltransferase [Candidatus Woesearchaeota archaeon]|nr:GNAT family N-acetyltransferase [Candidatus Woesearchaeota archaeon]